MKVFKMPESQERAFHVSHNYVEQLAREIQISLDDPRPNIPHDEAMSLLDMEIEKFRK